MTAIALVGALTNLFVAYLGAVSPSPATISPNTQLEHLAELLGTTPAALLPALTDSPPARAQPCGDPDLLHALLLHSGPHGAAPASITAALAWTLDRLEAAARTLRQSPPCPAVRLITTSGGDLALRANPDLLPAAVQNHTVDPDSDAAELDEYLLASLRRLLTDPLETIPHRHRQQLYERHLITVDADGAHLAPDVHFSLTHTP